MNIEHENQLYLIKTQIVFVLIKHNLVVVISLDRAHLSHSLLASTFYLI
jgi:hypothetical protein